MKKGLNRMIAVALLWCLVIQAFAQGAKDVADTYFRHVGDYAALFRGKALTRDYRAWATHPYWGDGTFREGRVSYQGVVYPSVMIRLDIMDQLLEVQTPEGQLIVLPKQESIDYFEVDGKRFVRHDSIFTRLEHEGAYASLELLRKKQRDVDFVENNKAYRNLKVVDTYLLRTAEGTRPIKRLSTLYKAFPQCKGILKDTKQLRRWRMRGEERGRTLTEAVALINAELGRAEVATELPVGHVQAKGEDAPAVPARSTTSEIALDSVADVTVAASLAMPAYEAFRPGRNVARKEVERTTTSGGISVLEVLREDRTLAEVELMVFRSNVGGVQAGAEKFRPEQLRNVPMALGEADVMKMVQTLPGVTTVGEASSGFNVRGGAADQNLVLMGGNTLYNPMHLFGLFSAVNTDAVNDVELFKGSMPAAYGGRLASVMNITARQASKQAWHGSASIGLVTSKAHLEMPIVKNRLSLLLNGRTTYSDWMLKLLPKKSSYRDGKAGFYDLGGTLAWTITQQHFLTVTPYYSHDRFSFSPADHYGYNNANVNAQWKALWTDHLSSTLNAGYDRYEYRYDDSLNVYNAGSLRYHIEQMNAKWHFELTTSTQNTVRWGVQNIYYRVMPGSYDPWGKESEVMPTKLDTQSGNETALYAEDEWEISERWTAMGALRYTMFAGGGTGKHHFYHFPEVRLSAAYKLTDNQSLKASFNTASQYIHKISNTLTMSPIDTWQLSNSHIRPQKGWQLAAGYYGRTNDRSYEFSAEVYYKQMSNYLTYRSGAQLTMNNALENDVIGADGQAYGIELQVKKPHGKLNGWVSYTFARTLLRQDKELGGMRINDGAWFAADCDRPHQLNIVANYKFTRRYSISANFDYATGRPITLPEGTYYDTRQHRYLPYYSQRNAYRLPDNVRLDLSFNIEPSHHLSALTHSWFSIGVYNALARRNVYNVYYVIENGEPKGKSLSIFGCPIPYVSYNIKF